MRIFVDADACPAPVKEIVVRAAQRLAVNAIFVANKADIPLAAALVERGVMVLDPRGTVYTAENVGEALALRNFHHELREGGVATGGPSGFGAKQAREFAGAFDRELSKAMRRRTGEGRP